MHELSICYEIIETLQDVVEENDVKEVQTVILEIGELSTMIPMYMYECFPCAADGTMFENTELKIETIAGVGVCKKCGRQYQLLVTDGVCPDCGTKDFLLLSGKEFNIKEIIAR